MWKLSHSMKQVNYIPVLGGGGMVLPMYSEGPYNKLHSTWAHTCQIKGRNITYTILTEQTTRYRMLTPVHNVNLNVAIQHYTSGHHTDTVKCDACIHVKFINFQLTKTMRQYMYIHCISCNSSIQPTVIINGTLTFSGQERGDISAMVKQLATHSTLLLCRY